MHFMRQKKCILKGERAKQGHSLAGERGGGV